MREFEIVAINESEADILLYGSIERWGRVNARDIKNLLGQAEAKGFSKVNLRVHSPGGEVMEGLAIYGAIEQSNLYITTIIEGISASMMTIVMLASDKVIATKNARIMLHEPYARKGGTAKQLKRAATELEKLRDDMAAIYAERTGKTPDWVKDNWLDENGENQWFSASEALKEGLIDEVAAPKVKVNAAASLDSDDYLDMVACYDTAFAELDLTKANSGNEQKETKTMNKAPIVAALMALGIEFNEDSDYETLAELLATGSTSLQEASEQAQQQANDARLNELKLLMHAKNVNTNQQGLYLDMAAVDFEKTKALVEALPNPVSLVDKAKDAKQKNKGRKDVENGVFAKFEELEENPQAAMNLISEEGLEAVEDLAKQYLSDSFK